MKDVVNRGALAIKLASAFWRSPASGKLNLHPRMDANEREWNFED
jgi:hypothetical protein